MLNIIKNIFFQLYRKFEMFIVVVIFFLLLYTESSDNTESLITTSVSPDGEYHLEAYLKNTHATVDFSILVYDVSGGDKELIYDVYSEREVYIEWVSDSEVSINDVILDLAENEKYEA